MKSTFIPSQSRGLVDHEWLKAAHSFSFGSYYDPSRKHFGLLRVLNDDIIEPSMGFDTHPHENMEIITILLEGALKHKDSLGHEYVIRKGEVQRMSAGTGIEHSEFNASDEHSVNLLQIWIFTKTKNIPPSYEQKHFYEGDRSNKLQLIVSPNGINGSLKIFQDAFLSLTDLKKNNSIQYTSHLRKGSGVYCFLIKGEVTISGQTLKTRDALQVSDFSTIEIQSKIDSEVLFIEVPMH